MTMKTFYKDEERHWLHPLEGEVDILISSYAKDGKKFGHRWEQRKRCQVWGMEIRHEDTVLSLPVSSRWGIPGKVVCDWSLSIYKGALRNSWGQVRPIIILHTKEEKLSFQKKGKMKISGRFKNKTERQLKIRIMALTFRELSLPPSLR